MGEKKGARKGPATGGGEGRDARLEQTGKQSPLLIQEGRKAGLDTHPIRANTNPVEEEQGEAVRELRRKSIRRNTKFEKVSRPRTDLPDIESARANEA